MTLDAEALLAVLRARGLEWPPDAVPLAIGYATVDRERASRTFSGLDFEAAPACCAPRTRGGRSSFTISR